MNYRNVGRSDLVVSAVGVGCNNFVHRCDLEQSRALVHKALDLGITLFDTADVYGRRGGSEEFLGRILGPRRKDVVLATKFGQPMDDAGKLKGASRAYIMTAVEASLRRLRTDWIDLYQLHWPYPETPIEETLRALDDLVHQGKVRYIGGSNFDGTQVAEADHVASRFGLHHFISFQSEYSLLARGVERELIPAMQACGAGLIPYYPLASGLLTGKYKPDAIPEGSRLASPRAPEKNLSMTPIGRPSSGCNDFAMRGAERFSNSRSAGFWHSPLLQASSPAPRGRSSWSKMLPRPDGI